MTTHEYFSVDLKHVRLELSQSLAHFGRTLAVAVRHKQPYSKQYIARLETGKDPITPEIAGGLKRIMAAMDDADPDTLTAQAVTVYAVRADVAGALVTGEARCCARPGCRVKFIPRSPRQKYHSLWCREQSKK